MSSEMLRNLKKYFCELSPRERVTFLEMLNGHVRP